MSESHQALPGHQPVMPRRSHLLDRCAGGIAAGQTASIEHMSAATSALSTIHHYMAPRYDIASNEDIVQHCSRFNSNRNVISELEGGLSIIRISEDAVVKCGIGVTAFEAQNQQRAYEIIDPSIIRIPQVYRFFSHRHNGYIIMEYVNGQALSLAEDPSIYLEVVAKVLKQFEQVRHDKPGPFHEGLAYGKRWLDYNPIAPATISDIEEYYNQRQLRTCSHVKLNCTAPSNSRSIVT